MSHPAGHSHDVSLMFFTGFQWIPEYIMAKPEGILTPFIIFVYLSYLPGQCMTFLTMFGWQAFKNLIDSFIGPVDGINMQMISIEIHKWVSGKQDQDTIEVSGKDIIKKPDDGNQDE